MRTMLFATSIFLFSSGAAAQTSQTDCRRDYFGNVQCTTRQQEVAVPPPLDYGAAISNGRAAVPDYAEEERKRLENARARLALQEQQEQEQQRRAQASAERAFAKALAKDTDTLLPTPEEKPVLLSCRLEGFTLTLALYEKNARVDVTQDGETKSRAAIVTTESVTWNSPVWRTSISRVDLSVSSSALLPELKGATVRGICALAERKF